MVVFMLVYVFVAAGCQFFKSIHDPVVGGSQKKSKAGKYQPMVNKWDIS